MQMSKKQYKYMAFCMNFMLDTFAPNEPVEKARFWLFSESQVFDFIDSEFMENAFSYRLND